MINKVLKLVITFGLLIVITQTTVQSNEIRRHYITGASDGEKNVFVNGLLITHDYPAIKKPIFIVEGFDINHPHDWQLAEEIIRTEQAKLPEIENIY